MDKRNLEQSEIKVLSSQTKKVMNISQVNKTQQLQNIFTTACADQSIIPSHYKNITARLTQGENTKEATASQYKKSNKTNSFAKQNKSRLNKVGPFDLQVQTC